MRTLDDLGELSGKTVLLRSDLNVPLDDRGAITDDGRVRASVPTITELTARGARVVVCAHLGRPKGQPDARFTLAPAARRLAELLGKPVPLAEDTVGPDAHRLVAGLRSGDVVMLENLRFNPGETSKDDAQRRQFAGDLAGLADVYVSDGFGVVHRKQASVYDVAELLPHAAGLLVQREVAALGRLDDPKRPYTVVLGGAKVSDKLGVIENLLRRADSLVIGGGMAFTFLAAQGHQVGKSLLESDQVDAVRGYLRTAADTGVQVVLPRDIVEADAFSADAAHRIVAADGIDRDQMGLDIGPQAAREFAEVVTGSRTVFWNGPMGAFEMAPFAAGTRAVADALVAATGEGAVTVVGGGDSAAAMRQFGYSDGDVTHISTGGGASLELLEGKTLPGLAVLE